MSKRKKPSEGYDVISDGKSEIRRPKPWWDIGLKPATWFFNNSSTITLTTYYFIETLKIEARL